MQTIFEVLTPPHTPLGSQLWQGAFRLKGFDMTHNEKLKQIRLTISDLNAATDDIISGVEFDHPEDFIRMARERLQRLEENYSV